MTVEQKLHCGRVAERWVYMFQLVLAVFLLCLPPVSAQVPHIESRLSYVTIALSSGFRCKSFFHSFTFFGWIKVHL